MNTNHNRIKVADLEVNDPDKILITNDKGELEFDSITNIKLDSYNALDYNVEGKVLDARQGKNLKDLIDNINLPIASDSETQIITVVTEDKKVVSRLKLFNWWTWIKSQAQIISSSWTFNSNLYFGTAGYITSNTFALFLRARAGKQIQIGIDGITTALVVLESNGIEINQSTTFPAGTTTKPSIILRSGLLTTVPQNGAIERDNSGSLWTTRNGVRYALTEDDGSYIKILINGQQMTLDTPTPYVSTNNLEDTLLGTLPVGSLSNRFLGRLTMIANVGHTIERGNIAPSVNKFQIVIKFSNALLNSSPWGPGYISELVLIDNVNITETTAMLMGTFAPWDSNVGVFNDYYIFDSAIPSSPKNLSAVSAEIICRRLTEFTDATNTNGNNQALRLYTTIKSTLIERIRV